MFYYRKMRQKDVAVKFPLHYYVWKNDSTGLQSIIEDHLDQVEAFDPRGRTPLMLAVTLEQLETSRVLLGHGASVNVENRDGWTGWSRPVV